VAAHVPGVGAPLKTVRGLSSAADAVAAGVVPATVDALRVIGPTATTSNEDQIDLPALSSLAGPMQQAALVAGEARAKADRLPDHTWFGPVNDKLATFRADIDELQQDTSDLAAAATYLPEPLGADGTKRYFLAFETESESRGLGGLPGDYAILTATHGRLSFSRFGSDNDLAKAHAHADLGSAFNAAYDDLFSPQDLIVNSDASPNFPDAARIWMSMWQDEFHQQLNGAIAVDPTALAALLKGAGAVSLSDGTQINSSNAVQFFENTVYVKYPDALVPSINNARKRYQIDAAQAVASKIVHQPLSQLVKSLSGLRQSAAERRLLVYTQSAPAEQYALARPLGGALPQTNNPFFEVTLNNSSAKKVDYYLKQKVTYQRASCAAGRATVTVTLQNTAPTSGLTPVIAGENAKPGTPSYARDDLTISLYSTHRSNVVRTAIDGHTGFVSTASENGHPMTTTSLAVRAGQTRTVTFTVAEPKATGPVLGIAQPAVNPVQLSVQSPLCRV
jgi:hypothetical protein